jgi:hypothetical protein
MKKLVLGLLFSCVGISHATTTPSPVYLLPSVSISSVAVSGAGATATVPVPGGVGVFSTGYFNYITHIHIEMYAVAALTGGVTPVTCTSTNLQGSMAWKFPTAAAIGTTTIVDEDFASPLTSSTAGAVSTVVCPATANVIWNVVVNFTQTP